MAARIFAAKLFVYASRKFSPLPVSGCATRAEPVVFASRSQYFLPLFINILESRILTQWSKARLKARNKRPNSTKHCQMQNTLPENHRNRSLRQRWFEIKCGHCHPFGLEDLNFLLNQVIVWNNVKQMAPNQKLNKVKAINGE